MKKNPKKKNPSINQESAQAAEKNPQPDKNSQLNNSQPKKKRPNDYVKKVSVRAFTRIEITGFNQMRIINTLGKENVPLRQIERVSGKILRVTLNKKDLKKAYSILDDMGYEHKVVEESGVNAVLLLLLKNVGLAAGILIFMVAAVFSNRFIWTVKISGNELIDSRVIELELGKQGIKQWSNKGSLDTDAIASALRNIEGIAEGTAYIKGTTLYINVFESQVYEPPDDTDLSGDIVSAHDAEITKVVTKKGTAVVKIGDKIAAGKPLIKGEIYNTNGELLEACRAKGEVYGKVTFTQSHIFSPIEDVFAYTGKTKKHTYMSIFGLRIGKSGLTNADGWEKETKTFSAFLIPIKFTQIFYRETQITPNERDIDAYVGKLKNEAVLNNVIKAGGSEIETITTLTPIEGGLMRLNIYIQAEVLIGSY